MAHIGTIFIEVPSCFSMESQRMEFTNLCQSGSTLSSLLPFHAIVYLSLTQDVADQVCGHD